MDFSKPSTLVLSSLKTWKCDHMSVIQKSFDLKLTFLHKNISWLVKINCSYCSFQFLASKKSNLMCLELMVFVVHVIIFFIKFVLCVLFQCKWIEYGKRHKFINLNLYISRSFLHAFHIILFYFIHLNLNHIFIVVLLLFILAPFF